MIATVQLDAMLVKYAEHRASASETASSPYFINGMIPKRSVAFVLITFFNDTDANIVLHPLSVFFQSVFCVQSYKLNSE